VEAIEDMDDSKAEFDKLVATYKTGDIDAIAKMITKMITVTLNTQTFY
jgi:flagellar motility protein MotE (MotC chaperone)